jgi:hypothetical protein
MHPIIFLWSHPRSLSTAFERSFRERGDCRCFHEPFMYYHYLEKNRTPFANFDADASHPTRYEDIKSMILDAAREQPVFVKDMGYYIREEICADAAFFERVSHSFLIRDPAASIASYFKLDPNFSSEEVGLEALHYLFQEAGRRSSNVPPVVDAQVLLSSPPSVMQQYCEGVGVEFLEHALHWDAKPPADWEAVMSWHGSVSQSTGFAAPKMVSGTVVSSPPSLTHPSHLLAYYEQHKPHYDAMVAHRIE